MSTAGLSWYHCLRATAVSRMYNAGIPESMISSKSGHRSVDELRVYEHPSEALERDTEDCIAGSSNMKKEEKVKDPPKPIPQASQLPRFTGMSNCSFTFNMSYNNNN